MKNLLFALTLIAFFLVSCGDEKKTTTTTTQQVETPKPEPKKEIPADIQVLLEKHTCLTCHKVDEKLIGPAYEDVAMRNYADEAIVNLIYNPKPENWPDYPPMLALKDVPQEDALKIAKWINSLND
jgi:cytochrome c